VSLLLANARVGDAVRDVAIVDGKLAATGNALDGSTQRIDLEGRWLSPGLWDNHVHFTQWSLVSSRLDVSAATSAAHAARLVAEGLATIGHPVPFVGYGFRDGLWPDAPSLDVLDVVTGAVPVVLVSADVHSVWLNSAALARYGRDGHPTGLFREDDAFDIERRIDTVGEAETDRLADLAAATAAARGVVGIVDYEMADNLDIWQRRQAAGATRLRVEFGLYREHLARAIQLGLRTGLALSPLLRVGRFKIITDGSLNTRTAYCHDVYPGLEGCQNSRGMLTVARDELWQLMRLAAEAGIEPAVHAIGDHANALALDAFDEVGCSGRIEHAQLLDVVDFPRFAALGVIASVQPEHAMDDRDVADRYWAGRTERSFVLKSLLEAGAELALGSDAPVAPLDPWITAAAAVTRSRDGRAPWHPEQGITPREAFAASTRGRLEAGQFADLVVTERDPFEPSGSGLRDMPVTATLVGGRFTHSRLAEL
jgi:predicted amidohydrolase YtcJ